MEKARKRWKVFERGWRVRLQRGKVRGLEVAEEIKEEGRGKYRE